MQVSEQLLFVLSFSIITFAQETSQIWPYQSFVTEPFHPPQVQVNKSGVALGEGYIFLTPSNEVTPTLGAEVNITLGAEDSAPLIMTDDGELIWNGPSEAATNLFVQTLDNKPVLSSWSGVGYNTGHGYGNVTIRNTKYKIIHEICPKLGLTTPDNTIYPCYADLHESYITDRGSILVTAYNITRADLSSLGGLSNGWIYDNLFYEIDIKTGEILFKWSPLEVGIPISSSKVKLKAGAGAGNNQSNPYDWFHINSVQNVGNGYLVNSRHCWTTYMINSNGDIEWQIDGSDGGDFTLPDDAHFEWQHHARVQKVTSTSLELHYFNNDNSNFNNGTHSTFGLDLSLNLTEKSATVLQILHDPDQEVYSVSQGSYYPLDNGNTLLGYGSIAKIKEYNADGDVAMTLQFGHDNLVQSYRAYRQVWHATPTYPPKAVGSAGVAYMSWNGATDVTQWIVFTGETPDSLLATGIVAKCGFETSFNLPSQAKYLQVAAFAKSTLLRESAVVKIV